MILRSNDGRKLGEVTQNGSVHTLRDNSGRRLGTYDENLDVTRDNQGNKVGNGNLLSMLLQG